MYDQVGNKESGVRIEFEVWVCGETPYDKRFYHTYGYTNSNGYFSLNVSVPYDEYPNLESMFAFVDDYRYTTLAAQNNYSRIGTSIYPRFDVCMDMDQNGIYDDWELPLAEKFCPTLKLHHATEWVAPEPVEYLGVTKQDLWFLLYNELGQEVGDWPISTTSQFDPPKEWMLDQNPNYSTLTGNGYLWVTRPPGIAYGEYWIRYHYNYAGNINNASGWINYYQNERTQNNYPHSVYAHLFLKDQKPIIQYWFFYPYNDGYNNHEGDWEHINIHLDSQNPSLAAIQKIDYYFHHKVKTLSSGFQIEDGTHPIIYIGGSCAGIDQPLSCEPGNHTGGSYPYTGTWYNVGTLGYDEYVNGAGPTIEHENITVRIIPRPDKIDYDEHPELCWLNVSIRFGILEASSPWDTIEPFANIWPIRKWVEQDVGNNAVPGPAYNEGWEKVGACEGYDSY